MNPSSRTNVLAKLSGHPFARTRLEYSYLVDNSTRRTFSFGYRYNPDGTATQRRNNQNHSLHWTHTPSRQSFYTIKLSRAQSSYTNFLYEDPTDPRYVMDVGAIGAGNVVGFPGNNFLVGGNQKGHVYEDSESLRAKLDFTRQFGVTHELKVGAEVQRHKLSRQNFVVLFDGSRYLEPTVESEDNPSHDRYTDQKVIEMSAYAQDKIEYDNVIINAGVRYERFEPNGRFIPNLFDPAAELASARNQEPVASPHRRFVSDNRTRHYTFFLRTLCANAVAT